MGRQCRELNITVRISDLDDDGPTLIDAAATWITAHTERVTFGRPYASDGYLLVDAVVHVPCKYLAVDDRSAGDGRGTRLRRTESGSSVAQATCKAHGYSGPLPRSTQSSERPKFQLGNETFSVIHGRRRRNLKLPLKRAAQRALPVVQNNNPCLGAPCRTADNKRGAACCRDISLEIALPDTSTMTEALLRSRKSPYLCKVKREDEDTVEAEVISACGYLTQDGLMQCSLHDRVRPNGRPAKPSICSEWPDLEPDETGHPGCRLI